MKPDSIAAELVDGNEVDRTFVAFYRTGVDDVFSYLARLTADAEHAADLTQDVFAAVYAELLSGRLDAPSVAWAITVGRNRFLDGLRRTRREEGRIARVTRSRPDVVEPDWDSIGGGEAFALLGRLVPEQRAGLVLRYVDDLPVVEVARLLHRSVAATDSLLARARRRLAALVEEDRRG